MLNRKQILKIRELDTEGFSVGQIAKELKISYKTVGSYLKSEEFSTHLQNLNNVEPASIPNVNDDPKHSEVILAPTLEKKLTALGLRSEDIFKVSPKLYYSKLNDVEKTALKIFLQRHDASAVKELKKIEAEIINVAKQELNRLSDECESGKLSFEECDRQSEELLLEVELFFASDT